MVVPFRSGEVSWSSAILCTNQADTLLQDNEFFFISSWFIRNFSFYMILKNSSCGAVHFFWGLPMCKTKWSFSLLDSKKNWHKIWNFNSTRNSYEITSPPFLILLVSEQFFFSSCVLGLKGARPYQDQTNINATITRESEERAVSWR